MPNPKIECFVDYRNSESADSWVSTRFH